MNGWADISSERVLLIILPAAIGPNNREHKAPPFINTAAGARRTADLILLIMLIP